MKASAGPGTARASRLRRPRWLPGRRLGLTLATAAAVLVLSAAMLETLRQEVWRSAEAKAGNLLQLLSRDVDRNIEVFDLSLQAVATELSDPELWSLRPEMRQDVLFDRAATARDLEYLKAFDPNGNVIVSSMSNTPEPENAADEAFFRVHRDRADIGLYVSQPFLARRTGEAVIALSRRLSQRDGSFAGVVVGTMRLGYVQRMFSSVDVGHAGSINLFRLDGALLMRKPYVWAEMGRSIGGARTYQEMAFAEKGRFVATAALDGIERLYIFTHLKNGPLFMNVALGVSEIYAEWWTKALLFGATTICLCVWTVVLALRGETHLRRREAAEARLEVANTELRLLARTDTLTGLANRRVFDDVFGREVHRVVRHGGSLSLVLLDADRFKAYNDAYGHLAGDQVLREIAAAISGGFGRASDQACRIGGEEFAVVLPDTNRRGASHVVEAIRAGLAARAIPHKGSAHGIVTLSIGVAHLRNDRTMTPDGLFAAADAALYEAKQGGRDRAVIVDAGADPRVLRLAG